MHPLFLPIHNAQLLTYMKHPNLWRDWLRGKSIHKAQLLSYMKLLDIPLGMIINFNVLKLTDGVSRLTLPGANLE